MQTCWTFREKKHVISVATSINLSLQELAGYAGGDVSFLKEDFEFQLNKQIFWDSVIFKKYFSNFWGY